MTSLPALRERHLKKYADARAARRLATRAAQVATWWASITEPKPQYLTPASLMYHLGKPLRRMAAALRWLGWCCIRRRIRGHQKIIWLPPKSL
jgi:hypothetical protein